MPLPFALDHINLWLLRDHIDGVSGWTLIDTGFGDASTRALWAAHFDDTMQGLPLLRVIVTHYHPDHMGNAAWLLERVAGPRLIWTTLGEFSAAHLVWNQVRGPERSGVEAEDRGPGSVDGRPNRPSVLVVESHLQPWRRRPDVGRTEREQAPRHVKLNRTQLAADDREWLHLGDDPPDGGPCHAPVVDRRKPRRDGPGRGRGVHRAGVGDHLPIAVHEQQRGTGPPGEDRGAFHDADAERPWQGHVDIGPGD